MKLLLLILTLFGLSACSAEVKPTKQQEVKRSSFNDVWSQLKSDPYEKLPQREISYFKLDGKQNIKQDAVRTLSSRADILEPFLKLAHPNGICFKGIWKIDAENPYGGYFKKGSEALIIARASTAMSNTKSGSTRAFGFAGKLFPTMNPDELASEPSANFFLIEDLGGTDAEHFMDVALTNEPIVSITLEVLAHAAYGIKVANTFEEVDSHPSIRQLYEISYLGESETAKLLTPKWLKIEANDSVRVDAKDFRDELRLRNDEELVFKVSVASKMIDEKKAWQRVGSIRLNKSVVSNSCDGRLHFHHPRFRDDLDYY